MTEQKMIVDSDEHDITIIKLSSLVDGELSEEERASVEAHLETCAKCCSVLEDLRAVKTWVSSDVATAADRAAHAAWSELRDALPARNNAERIASWARLSIAASVIIAVLIGGMWWKTHGLDAPVRTASTTSTSAPQASAFGQLEALAHARLTALPASKSQALQSSLDIIDDAIADARSARMADPGNDFVATYLDNLLKQKADALRKVVEMADAESTS
jgi:anti-sigma factor RsiW